MGGYPADFSAWTKAEFIAVVECTLEVLSERVDLLKRNANKSLVVVVVVLESLRREGSLEERKGYMQDGVIRIIRAIRKDLIQRRNGNAGVVVRINFQMIFVLLIYLGCISS